MNVTPHEDLFKAISMSKSFDEDVDSNIELYVFIYALKVVFFFKYIFSLRD